VASGLGTFRGKAAGIWPPLQKLGIEFPAMSTPSWFNKAPGQTTKSVNFAWAFWKFRWDAYTKNAPHKGYDILRSWAANKKFGAFSFTSNIDGHWLACGMPEDRVLECHGAIRFMQCHHQDEQVCKDAVWPTDPKELEMVVSEETDCVKEPMPSCMHCKGMARPNVLMFNDYGFIDTRYHKQSANYAKWLQSVGQSKAKVVIIEIGAGTAIPTVRQVAEKQALLLGATLIRINPEAPQIPPEVASRTGKENFSFTQDSLALLEALDALIEKKTAAAAGAAAAPAKKA